MSNFVDDINNSDSSYKVAFNCDSNWNIAINNKGKALSIAKVKGCESTFFGDVSYILKLIRSGYWDAELKGITEYGLEVFGGLHSRLIKAGTPDQFGILTMNND